MRFLTRELVDAIGGCGDRVEARRLERLWKTQSRLRLKHIKSIRGLLPPAARFLCDLTLHDGQVLSARQSAHDEVVIVIDATRNPWGEVGVFRLQFSGVKAVKGLEEIVGDHWKYEEVDLGGSTAFEYSILFHKSELLISADGATLSREQDGT